MNTRTILQGRIVLISVMLLLSATGIMAQEFRGTITGTVADPNGAVAVGATVVVKNKGTNLSTTVTTNGEGSYTVPFLVPGVYDVTVTASGFKTTSRENIEVGVSDRVTVDMTLQIGTSAEINVSAGEELLDRGNVSVGTSVSQRQVAELPLAEGAPYTLATQAPGVVYTGDPNFQGPTANGNLAGFRTNGTAGNQINLDGSPNLAYGGQVAYTAPSDAVQEFKVETNSFDAQSGFTSGSTVNVALKSGTSKLHGSAYLYDRAKNRTANNFFNNAAGRPRPDRQYDRYGFVINGPVYIPKLVEGKKTFFLFSYERQKDNVAQPTTYSVPTSKMRMGDFSELIVDPTNIASSANTVIYNPFSGTTSGSNVVRTSFGCPTSGPVPTGSTCNILPANLIYAPALAFMANFPTANLPGITNNYITDQNLIRPYRSYLAKIDHNFSSNTRISGKWYHSRNTEDRYNLTGTPDSIFRGYEDRRNWGGNVDYTSALKSNLILDVRGSWNEFKLHRYQDGPSAADLGFTGVPTPRQNNTFPRFDFRNYLTVGALRSDYNDGQNRPFYLVSFQPTITQLMGKHTFKYGFDFRHLNERFLSLGNATGRFTIDGTYTAPASNSSSTLRNLPGRDLASFLLGVITSGSIDNPTAYNASENYYAVFFQDDFNLSSKITLNLGLRYDYETGVRESQGRIVTDFNRTIASPVAAQALANYNSNVPSGVPVGSFANLQGGLIFANDQSTPNQRADKKDFQPRLGISYAIGSKTVVRAGYGIFIAPFQIQTIFQPGFSSPTTFTASTNNGLTFLATMSNMFPSGIAASPGTAQGLMTFTGRDVTSANTVGPTSTVLLNTRQNASYSRFVFGVQRELFYGIAVEGTYIYSRGYHLAVSRELNAIPAQYLNNFTSSTDPSTILAAITAVNTNLNGSVPNPLRGLIPDGGTWNANTIQRRRLLVPFPQFGNIAVTEYNGTSLYQSLQFQIVKRFTQGLSLNGSYTFSREHQKTQYLNPQDTELTDIVSPTERPHRFTASAIYELPFGRGRQFGKDWHPVLDGVLGGWQIQGIYEWQSGEPLQFPNVYYNGDPTKLVNMIGKKDGQGRRYGVDIPGWDITGFYIGGVPLAANVPGYGNNYTSGSANTIRTFPLTLGQFRNQRFLKFDAGISKNFRIKEGMKFQIRVEAINLLNSPYFTVPTLDPTNSKFGYTAAPTRQPPRDIQIGGRFVF